MSQTATDLIVDAWVYSPIRKFNKKLVGDILDTILSHPQFSPLYFSLGSGYSKIKGNEDKLADSALQGDNLGVSLSRNFRPKSHLEISNIKFNCTNNASKSSAFNRQLFSTAVSPDKVQELINYYLEITQSFHGYYAFFCIESEFITKNELQWESPDNNFSGALTENESSVGIDLQEGIPGIYWGNYFSAFYVNWFGKEKFENIPCYQKQWFADGGIFFSIARTPNEWDTLAARQLVQQIKEHLGVKAFFDMETVKEFLKHDNGVLGADIQPEFLQSPRSIPKYPFDWTVRSPRSPHTSRAPIVIKEKYDDPITNEEELRQAYPAVKN